MMKILITGAKGFVGKNLIAQLKNIQSGKEQHSLINEDIEIMEYDVDTDLSLLDEFCSKADFVFNLAGVNRPKNIGEFMSGNFEFAETLLDTLKKHRNICPIMLSSSIQAEFDNPYGKSKKAGEDLFFSYSKETGAKALVYRFPNLFGKWCRPNYNSVVATFCDNIAKDLPIKINDPSVELNLVYIDDVVNELIGALVDEEHRDGNYCFVPQVYKVKVGEIAELLYSFKQMRYNLTVPNLNEEFTKKLYSSYLSYIPPSEFSYPLKMNIDERGSFTEIIRTKDRGQISINISKPGITKGQHWHHTKNEKFIVVHGHGLIQLRKIGYDVDGEDYPIITFEVNGDKMEVVEMIPGYTHNIVNLSSTEDLVTVMWANESFDPYKPDTFYEEVEKR